MAESDKGELRVRPAAEADTDAIRTLLVEAYSQYESTLPEGRWPEYKKEIEESVTKEGPLLRLVAELNGQIVGSVLLFGSSAEAYGLPELGIQSSIIRLLSVSPQVRGKGIAKALIREAARYSLERGDPTLHLHTSDIMADAIKLYERLGFERAYEKDIIKGEVHVKSFVLHLQETALH